MFRYFLSLILLIPCIESHPAQAQEAPFSRGVNLTEWFQVGSARQIQFTRYTKKDFEQIKSLGCDVIRLPINLHHMTNGEPNYALDPLFYTFLDQIIDWAEALDIHLILDNHTFDPAADTDPEIGIVLKKVWSQLADRYKDRSELLYYEILNEPHGITDELWNTIQQEAVEEIRKIDKKHTIIIGPANWNSYHHLHDMPVYADDNLIYTHHFYEPFIFTHQGAGWTDPSLVPLAGVPFPYEASRMPSLPASLTDTWIGNSYRNYEEGGTINNVRQELDVAVRFKDDRQVPLFCGEFGVLMINAENEDRVKWYRAVREYLEQHDIAWTSWDYHGGFGLFEKGSNGLFEHDLNVPLLEALGFNVPEQSPYVLHPDSTGFILYTDYMGEDIVESSDTRGYLDYYAGHQPNNDDYCMAWRGAQRYNVIGFDFRPDKDLSLLVDSAYAVDFFVRGNQPGTRFDIRFVDSKTEITDDLPWRMVYTIDEALVNWDGRWQHLHIPLSRFTEKGSWYDNQWHDPQGKFDWTAVDRFEIVAEYHDLDPGWLWFDQMVVTGQDTARVRENGMYEVPTGIPVPEKAAVRIYPNPFRDRLLLEYPVNKEWLIRIINLSGSPVYEGNLIGRQEIDLSDLSAGAYILHLTDKERITRTFKLIKTE